MSVSPEKTNILLLQIIKQKPTFSDGFKELKIFLETFGAENILAGLDLNRMQGQFKNWLITISKEGQVPKLIKSLYFELLTTSGQDTDDDSNIMVQFSGSATTPVEDPEWHQLAAGSYLPENKFFIPDDFKVIQKNISRTDHESDLATISCQSLLILLLLNSASIFVKYLMRKHDSLYIGTGSDIGNVYLIGKLMC